jgi:drug/metabolite transporter (DMT)-like permease
MQRSFPDANHPRMMSKRFSSQGLAILALFVLVLIWGYNWVVMKIAIRYAAPFDYAALRVLLGGLSLLLVLAWRKQPLRPKRAAGAAAVGLLQMTCFYGLSTWALVSGGAGKTAVLNYAMPFWVLFLAWFILRERPARLQWISVAVGLAGLVCILMPFSLAGGVLSKGLALASSLCWAGGIIIAKRLQQREPLDLLSFTTWQMLFGGIPLLAAALLIPSPPIVWSGTFIAALIFSVIPGNALAWLLWAYALSRLPAGVAGLGTLGAPVIGVLAAQLQLGETPTWIEGVGMLLILGALLLNSVHALRSQKAA